MRDFTLRQAFLITPTPWNIAKPSLVTIPGPDRGFQDSLDFAPANAGNVHDLKAEPQFLKGRR